METGAEGAVEGTVEVSYGKATTAEVVSLFAGLDKAGSMFRQRAEAIDNDGEGCVRRGFSVVAGCCLGQIVDPEDRVAEEDPEESLFAEEIDLFLEGEFG